LVARGINPKISLNSPRPNRIRAWLDLFYSSRSTVRMHTGRFLKPFAYGAAAHFTQPYRRTCLMPGFSLVAESGTGFNFMSTFSSIDVTKAREIQKLLFFSKKTSRNGV